MITCLICCEERELVVIGSCNHALVCLECVYKMRIKNGDKNCVMCKTDNSKVIVTKNDKLHFQESFCKEANLFKEGMYVLNPALMKDCKKLESIVC